VSGVIHWAEEVGDDWAGIRAELTRAFEVSRASAQAGESFVFVIRQDDLLGRRGAGNAMVATGLLSAARTAALEGARKGWTATVVAFDEGADPEAAEAWAQRLLDSGDVTGDLVHLGPGHVGKTLA
jgi:ABC-type branched-subunit amino acid transport system substrate-binding protein